MASRTSAPGEGKRTNTARILSNALKKTAKPARAASKRSGGLRIASRRYTVVYQAVPPEDGAGYYAHIPALDITTEGETLKEAKEMARDAIECYLETVRTIGQPAAAEAASEVVEVAM